MKKIKIAHILHSVGGVDVYLRLIIENLECERFLNVVVHGRDDTQKIFLDSKGNITKNYKTAISRNISILKDIRSIVDTYRFLRTERPDIIHAHSAKGGVIGKIVGRLLGIKILYTPHAFSYLSSQNKLKKLFFLTIERLLANSGSVILATSNSEKVRALTEVWYKQKNTELFNNCIEPITSIHRLTIDKCWPDDYICTVGRPSYQKNIELMIKVLYEVNKVKKIHMVIMGVGHHVGQLDSVKNLIKELKMSGNVTLLDWTERSDVFNIISKSKFYISTSRYEGLPYSIVESLALSKPCVVTFCDGNKDLIEDGYNGFVIKNDDIVLFRDRILRLLSEKELLAEFSHNAYQSFAKNYNIKKNITQLEAIYLKYS